MQKLLVISFDKIGKKRIERGTQRGIVFADNLSHQAQKELEIAFEIFRNGNRRKRLSSWSARARSTRRIESSVGLVRLMLFRHDTS